MQYEPTLSIRVYQPFVHHVHERLGLRPEIPSSLLTAHERVSHADAIEALSRCVETTRDPALGLHVGAGLERGALDLLEYLARSCETLGEALDTVSRFRRLAHDALEFELTMRDGHAVWSFGIARGLRWHPAATDFLASCLVRCVRDMTANAVTPELRLRREAPARSDEYASTLGCSVRFGAEEDALVLPERALGCPLEGADTRLRRLLERQALHALDALPQQHTFAARVVDEIQRALDEGHAHVDPVARSLGVSPRTLRRRLQDEGTSFGALLDDLRREMALDRLAGDRTSIPEIASGLGFTRIPSFYRAFKRWTGTTPAEYRQRLN